MAQSGISYAAGQLLAVVAPRTVLVVDAPTDWSLAGPLWELALDDAPVDEILDVLVRRGIRTAPSFAIVRVEGEAVRALVRGSVPVCFERAGEPVRLDATGATTWLEGLISGARRVLVGDVETTSDLPFLVSTGVVLVSGLALPCGAEAAAPDASGELPQVEDIEPGEADPDSGPDSGPGLSDEPVAPEVPSPSESPYAPATASAAPRVVDLTRSAPRTPAQAFATPEPASARAFAPAGPAGSEIGGSTGLNGHVLHPVSDRESYEQESFEQSPYDREVYDRQPYGRDLERDLDRDLEPAAFREFAPSQDEAHDEAGVESPAADPGRESTTDPVFEDDRPTEAYRPSFAPAPSLPAPQERDEPVEAFEAPAVEPDEAPEAPSFFDAASPVAPAEPEAPRRTEEYGDDYGDATVTYTDDDYDEPAIDPAIDPADDQAPVGESVSDEDADSGPASVEARAGDDLHPDEDLHSDADLNSDADLHSDHEFRAEVDPFDDLLIDGEPAAGPSPADLPNFASPSVSIPPRQPAAEDDEQARGQFDFPQQSRFGSGSAPAAWPPPEQPAARADQRDDRSDDRFDDRFDDQAESPVGSPVNGRVNGAFAPVSEPEQDEVGFDSLLADGFRPPAQPSAPREQQNQPAGFEPGRRDLDRYDPLEAYQSDEAEEPGAGSPADGGEPDDDDQQPGGLPFRVRGQSLRPEQRVPLDQKRGLNGGLSTGLNGRSAMNRELPPRPEVDAPAGEPAPASALGSVGAAGPKPQVSPSPSPSGGLLLPSFFRGARAARKSGSAAEADQPQLPVAREGVNGNGANGNGANGQNNGDGRPWPGASAGQAPSAWAPPVRRGLGDRGPDQPPRPDGPPAMPNVLRQAPNGAPQGGTPGDAEPPREPPRLLGVWCDAGHVTSPDHDTCRVCGLPVPPQAPILVARPPLGVLVFDNGDRVEVDRPVVLGRDPKPVTSPDPEQPVLHPVASATGQVSRTHAEVRASGWDVVLTDLDAMNGTALTLPGQPPVAIEPGVPTVIVPGARVDLGGETGFVFEIEG